MARLHVSPLPEPNSPSPEIDPLLEKFRQATIKGEKIVGKPRRPTDSAAGAYSLDTMMFNIDATSDTGVCDTDFDLSCDP